MDLCEFEYITCDMEIVTDSMRLLLDSFCEFLDNTFCEICNENKADIFKNLRAYEFLFKQTLKSFCSLREKYQEQIELHYSNLSS